MYIGYDYENFYRLMRCFLRWGLFLVVVAGCRLVFLFLLLGLKWKVCLVFTCGDYTEGIHGLLPSGDIGAPSGCVNEQL